MKTERIDYIDNAKGFLIILVVLGHYIEPYTGDSLLLKTIYAFHMPAFFCITGILQNFSDSYQQPFHNILLKKTRALLIPFICFEALNFVVKSVCYGPQANFNGFVYNIITMQFWNIVDWYLVSLFFADIVFVLLRKNCKELLVPVGVVFCICSFITPWPQLSRTMIAFSFIVLGYYGSRLFTQKRSFCYAVIAVALTIFFAYLNPVRVDLNNGVYGNLVFFAIGAVSGSYATMQFSQHINILAPVGRISLYIMGIHLPLKIALGSFL